MVFLVEVRGQMEEEVETVEVGGDKGRVIGLANARHCKRAQLNTKGRLLCRLLVVLG